VKDAAAPGPPRDPLLAAPPSLLAAPPAAHGDVEPAALPRDHPAWQRDVLAVSARVRALVAGLRPVVVRVLSFWDHAVRSIPIGGRRLEVDPSGCYRIR
jgi:hypothetical protein